MPICATSRLHNLSANLGQANDFLGSARATFGMTINEYKVTNSGSGGAAVSAANMIDLKSVLGVLRASGKQCTAQNITAQK